MAIKILLRFLVGCAIASIAGVSPAQEDASPCAMSAAQEGVAGFLAKIPAQYTSEYGFESQDEARSAVLAQPYRLRVITPASLSQYVAGDPLEGLLSITAYWYFPLLARGTPRAFAVVEESSDGACRLVSLGYASLVKRIKEAQAHAADTAAGTVERKKLLIVVHQAREYLLADTGQTSSLVSLRPPSDSADKNASTAAVSLDSTVNRLKALVEQSLKAEPLP